MTIRRLPDGGLLFRKMPLAHYRLLQQIPVHADPAGCHSAHERLYQNAVETPEDDEADDLNSDWQDFVVPELQGEFSRQLDLVSADLARATEQPGNEAGPFYDVSVPHDHIDAWYGALNQARLVMQERYRFPEKESPEALFDLLESEHIGPYFTSRFYVEVQSALLDLGMGVYDDVFPFMDDPDEDENGGGSEDADDDEDDDGSGPKWA